MRACGHRGKPAWLRERPKPKRGGTGFAGPANKRSPLPFTDEVVMARAQREPDFVG